MKLIDEIGSFIIFLTKELDDSINLNKFVCYNAVRITILLEKANLNRCLWILLTFEMLNKVSLIHLDKWIIKLQI